VRLAHGSTGVVVTATERRSQLQNRGAALERLRERLRALSFVPKVRRPTRATRGSQERRLSEKRRRAEHKAGRRGGVED
jgi:protein subunit release factor B